MQAWLDPQADDAAGLVDLVRAGAHDVAEGWTIDAVGTAVGNVRNDSPELIQPVEACSRRRARAGRRPQSVTLPPASTVQVGLKATSQR